MVLLLFDEKKQRDIFLLKKFLPKEISNNASSKSYNRPVALKIIENNRNILHLLSTFPSSMRK